MPRPVFLARASLVALVSTALSCATRPPGQGPMEAALEAAREGSASPRELALAAWHAYLVGGEPRAAERGFAAAGGDPVALAGRLELARRSLQLGARARAAIALARKASGDPLGAIGARAMLDMLGTSPGLDGQLAAAAEAILRGKTSPQVSFLCRLIRAREAESRMDASWQERFAEMGAVSQVAVVGPFGGLRNLDFPTAYPPQTERALSERYQTPVGEVQARAVPFPDADLRLYGEPDRGDVFYLAADLTARGGAYVLHAASPAPFDAFLDGKRVAGRAPASLAPSQLAVPVGLAAGPHRLLVKLSRVDGGNISLFLSRADGQPEDLHVRAARGEAPGALVYEGPLPEVPSSAEETARALAPTVGDEVARFLAARDAQARDLEGSKALLAGLGPAIEVAPLLLLRAQLELADRSLPERTAKGRAGRDLEEATAKDPAEASGWLLRAAQARDEERFADAEAFLDKVRVASTSPLLQLAEARLALARGLDALADAAARRAEETAGGLCAAAALRYDLARRNDAVAEADALVRELEGCPDGAERAAEHALLRGDLAAAERAEQIRLERVPADWRVAAFLADAWVAAKRYPEAIKALSAEAPLWPRLAALHRRLAEVMTLAGDAAGARVEKEAALRLDGGDLQLRRELALAQGHDLLDDLAVDGKQAIAAYAGANLPAEGASASAYVLDMAGIEVYPDGSQVERIHTIAKVLDQRGIPQLAEQRLPPGAIALKLRTVKKDGRVLEPEAIADKEAVSLPNVDVGDYVEVEYLSSVRPRNPAVPGFAAVPFYFRIADAPLFHSTYTFRAPVSVPLEVDAHNMAAPELVKQGQRWVVHHEVHQAPPVIPEPNAPGANELLPFLQLGTGAGVLEGLLPFADAMVGHDAPTLEVAEFARAAAAGKSGRAAVEAVYAAVMEKVKGDENAIDDRASTTLAHERGSRLWLLKGALRALGVASRVALVRPLTSDPAPYRFPSTELYTYPVLELTLPGEPPLWLDPSARFAPFGALPEQASGEREAAVLPEPGERIRLTKTPPAVVEPKEVMLHLTLSPEGDVTAEGQEVYRGFDAAFLRQALDRLDEPQRRQAVEVALARSFRDTTLDALVVHDQPAVGAPLSFEYKFHSPRWGHREGSRLILANPIFPAALGQRFVSLAARSLPLLIANSEKVESEYRIDLPPGFHLVGAGPAADLRTPFGAYQRVAKAEGKGPLVIDERTELRAGRIIPAAYPDFVRFAAAVDQAQSQEIDLAQ